MLHSLLTFYHGLLLFPQIDCGEQLEFQNQQFFKNLPLRFRLHLLRCQNCHVVLLNLLLFHLLYGIFFKRIKTIVCQAF